MEHWKGITFMYINVGAKCEHETEGKIRLERVVTKKLLKTLLMADESSVIFDQTSMFDNGYQQDLEVNDIKDGDMLVVVGPDPFSKRNWYANVGWKNGKVVVS
jgi:hypothetical protein